MRRTAPRLRRLPQLALALAFALAFAACTGGEPTTPKPQPAGRMTFVVTTTLTSPREVTSYSVARLRVVAADGPAAGTAILSQAMPVSYPWEAPTIAPVPLDLAGVTASRVVVEVELMHWHDSTTVEWAARSDTIALRDGPIALPLRFGRGPIGNLAVQAVTLAPANGAPEPLVMAVGEALPVSVTAVGAVRRYSWVTDGQVAMLVNDSLVVARAPGTAQAIVAAGLHADTLDVVVQPRATSLSIAPDEVVVTSLSDTAAFTVTARDAAGAEVRPGLLLWRSANPVVAQPLGPPAAGRFLATFFGETTIEARLATDTTVRASARLVVRQRIVSLELAPAGGTLTGVLASHPLAVTAYDARHFPVGGRAIAYEWSIAGGMRLWGDAPNARVLLAEGRTGTADVTVRAEGVSTTGHYQVVAAVTAVSVGGPSRLFPGGTATLSAALTDETGTTAPALAGQLRWSSGNPAVASVSEAGVVTAHAEGRAVIAAALPSGVRGELAVDVVPPPASMRITTEMPPISWPSRGNEVRMGVQVLDRNGAPVPGVPVRWLFDVGTLGAHYPVSDGAGLAEAYWSGPAAGVYTVRAVVDGTSASVGFQVFIAAAAPARFELLQPPPDTVASGVTWSRQPVVRILDVNGQPMVPAGIPVRAVFWEWTGAISGTTTAPIDASGVARFHDLALTAPPGKHAVGFETAGLYATYFWDLVVKP